MDHILQLYKYATFKIIWNFFYNFLTKCLFFINPKSSLSVLSINSISTIIQSIQVGHFSIQPISDWPFQINQLPPDLSLLSSRPIYCLCMRCNLKQNIPQFNENYIDIAYQLANIIMREVQRQLLATTITAILIFMQEWRQLQLDKSTTQ